MVRIKKLVTYAAVCLGPNPQFQIVSVATYTMFA